MFCLSVLLCFFLTFCQFLPSVAYESDTYKKACVLAGANDLLTSRVKLFHKCHKYDISIGYCIIS